MRWSCVSSIGNAITSPLSSTSYHRTSRKASRIRGHVGVGVATVLRQEGQRLDVPMLHASAHLALDEARDDQGDKVGVEQARRPAGLLQVHGGDLQVGFEQREAPFDIGLEFIHGQDLALGGRGEVRHEREDAIDAPLAGQGRPIPADVQGVGDVCVPPPPASRRWAGRGVDSAAAARRGAGPSPGERAGCRSPGESWRPRAGCPRRVRSAAPREFVVGAPAAPPAPGRAVAPAPARPRPLSASCGPR